MLVTFFGALVSCFDFHGIVLFGRGTRKAEDIGGRKWRRCYGGIQGGTVKQGLS